MRKMLKVADGAFFIPSYPEQTVILAFSPALSQQVVANDDETETVEEANEEPQLSRR